MARKKVILEDRKQPVYTVVHISCNQDLTEVLDLYIKDMGEKYSLNLSRSQALSALAFESLKNRGFTHEQKID